MFRESSYFAEIDTQVLKNKSLNCFFELILLQTPLNSKILKLEAFDADEGFLILKYYELYKMHLLTINVFRSKWSGDFFEF